MTRLLSVQLGKGRLASAFSTVWMVFLFFRQSSAPISQPQVSLIDKSNLASFGLTADSTRHVSGHSCNLGTCPI